MSLDLPTLVIVFLQTTAVLGALLLFSWVLNRQVPALAWWGGAFLLLSAGIALILSQQGAPSVIALLLANGLLTLAYGFLYSGCRVFNGRPAIWWTIAGGLGVWCLVLPLVADSPEGRRAVTSGIGGVYTVLSAWELWRHARHRLASQVAAIFLLVVLVAFNGLRGGFGFSLAHAFWIAPSQEPWSGAVAIVLVTIMPALAFIFLSLAKEQLEHDYRQAALVDPLTGLPNRRAFFQEGPALLARYRAAPVSCLLFDLDGFKRINDQYGHDVGDDVIRIFGRILSEHMKEGVYSRLGGEEFAALVLLPDADARALAERIRQSFGAVGKVIRGLRVEGTVSVGCATGVNTGVQDLLRQADLALYRAKAAGRNVVVGS